jgi:hypothetical protein
MSAIPLVAVEDGKYIPNEEALRWLETLGAPLCVISCAGKYRTGKSTLLNRGILELPPGKKGFGVGNTTQACTKGLWVFTKVIDCERGKAIVVDTEGFGAIRVDQTHDTRIFALALLISSMFIYNAEGSIDEQSIETLRVVCNICQCIRAKADSSVSGTRRTSDDEDVPAEAPESLADLMPALVMVLRNFTLQIATEKAMTGASETDAANQYLEEALALGGGSFSSEQIRKTLRTIFKDRGCATLPPPSGDEEVLQQMNSISLDKLRPGFVRQLKSFRRRIGHEARPKQVLGKNINGFLLAAYIRSLAAALNEGAAPVIHDQWTALATMQRQKLVDSALRHHERGINAIDLAKPRAELKRELTRLEQEAVEKVRKNIMLEGEAAEEALVEVQSVCVERNESVLAKRDGEAIKEVGRVVELLERDVTSCDGDAARIKAVIDQTWEKLEERTGAGQEVTDPVRAAWCSEMANRMWGWAVGAAECANEWRRKAEAFDKEVQETEQRLREFEFTMEEVNQKLSDAKGELEVARSEHELAVTRHEDERGKLEDEIEQLRATSEDFRAQLEVMGPMQAKLQVAERSLAEAEAARTRAVEAEEAARANAAEQIATMEKTAQEAVTEARSALDMQRQRADRAERQASHDKEELESRVNVLTHDLQSARAETKRATEAMEEANARHQSEFARVRKELARATQRCDEQQRLHATELDGLREEVRKATEERSIEHKARLHERMESTSTIKDLEVKLACVETAATESKRRLEEEEERSRAMRNKAESERTQLSQAQSELQFLRDDRKGLEDRLRDASARVELLEREAKEVAAKQSSEMARVRMAHEREIAVLEQRLARAKDA